MDRAAIPQQPQELIQEWTLRNLSLATNTIEDTVKFLAKRKLLANSGTCAVCNRLRTIHQDHTKIDNVSLGQLYLMVRASCYNLKQIHGGIDVLSSMNATL